MLGFPLTAHRCALAWAAIVLSCAEPLAAQGPQCRDLATHEVTGADRVEWASAATQPYYSFKAGGVVFVREKATHREVLKFEGHRGDSGAVMHPDRPRLLIEGSYRSFQMRELPSGQAVGPAFEASVARLVDDRFLELWRFIDRKLLRSIVEAETGREVVRVPWFAAERVTAERTLLAYPGDDGRRIVIRDLSAGRELGRIDVQSDPRNPLLIAFIGDVYVGITARDEPKVRIYELAGGREVATYQGHAAVGYQSGRIVLMGGDEGVELLDSPTARPRLALPAFGHYAQLGVGADGKLAAIVTYPNVADRRRAKIDATMLWEPLNGVEIARWPAAAAMLSPTGTRAALFLNRGAVLSVRIVDTASGRELCADELNARGYGRIRWNSETGLLVEGLRDGERERVMFLDAGRTPVLIAGSGAVPAEARDRARTIFSEAFAAFQRGDFDRALRGFEAGLAIDTINAQATYYLAETHLRQGRRAEAVIAFRRARELAPDSREAAQALERLAQLGADGAQGPGRAAPTALTDPEHAQLLVSQALRLAAGRVGIGSRQHGYIDGTWNWGYLHGADVEGLMVAADPKAGDVLIDLDSGNGAVPLYAAIRFGLRAVGIQSDPEVARIASEAARALGVSDRVRFVAGDPLAADLATATIVTINGKLRKDPEMVRKWVAKLRALPRTVRIASSRHNDWTWVPDRVVTQTPGGKGYIHPTGLWFGRDER